MMIYRNGKIQNGIAPEELSLREIEELSILSKTHLGETKHLAPVLSLSETPPFWELPTPKLGCEWASKLSGQKFANCIQFQND